MAYISPRPSYTVRPTLRVQRGFFFGLIMVGALAAFELFNFGTTEYALYTVFGRAGIIGIHWASVLALAFCCIDFAGLARLFTPEQGRDEPKEIWYLLGAWFLGASVNAIMTWWAITNVLVGQPLGNEVLSREQLLHWVPIFLAALVWLTRVLIIGAVGIAGERLFTLGDRRGGSMWTSFRFRGRQPATSAARVSQPRQPAMPRPQPRRAEPELTYESVEEERPQPSPFGSQGRPEPIYGRTRPAPKPSPAPGASYGFVTAPREPARAWDAPGRAGFGNGGYYFSARPAAYPASLRREPGAGGETRVMKT